MAVAVYGLCCDRSLYDCFAPSGGKALNTTAVLPYEQVNRTKKNF